MEEEKKEEAQFGQHEAFLLACLLHSHHIYLNHFYDFLVDANHTTIPITATAAPRRVLLVLTFENRNRNRKIGNCARARAKGDLNVMVV